MALALSIVAILFAAPAFFLSLYNAIWVKVLDKTIGFSQEHRVSKQTMNNTARNIVDGMGMGSPAIYDNLETTYDQSEDDFAI